MLTSAAGDESAFNTSVSRVFPLDGLFNNVKQARHKPSGESLSGLKRGVYFKSL